MFFVVCDLDLAPPLRLLHSPLHRISDPVSVQDRCAVDVSRRPPHCLDQRSIRAQEAFLVGVKDRDQAHLRQVQPLPQQVDPDDDVVGPQPQVTQDLDPLERLDLAVEVMNLDAQLTQIARQVLGHTLGERGDQYTLTPSYPHVDLAHQVIHLALDRSDDDLGIYDAGGADDLLDDLLVVL